MTDKNVISVRDVKKTYKVRHEKGRTLKEAFLRQKTYMETVNALNGVSFDVPQGTTVGLIGSNGSGKSTMLKLIAGTSRPNAGEVIVSGRISALLELGAGFHPDFTGRENIFLDGIIMGLSREEISRRFDEIVAFAEMEEFIDAPTKTYSSGMFMRLAFSVAISVDPDILLIDEVLAVGDDSYQRKCLARINEFKARGKTIIFVSHSMASVRKLCDSAVWLDRGKVGAHGATEKVIDEYLSAVYARDEGRESTRADQAGEKDEKRWGNRSAEITGVRLLDEDGKEKHIYATGDYMKVQVSYKAHERTERPEFFVVVRTVDGTECFNTSSQIVGRSPDYLPDSGMVELEFEDLPFLRGHYKISAVLKQVGGRETYDYHDGKYTFEIVTGAPFVNGIIRVPCNWLNWPGGE